MCYWDHNFLLQISFFLEFLTILFLVVFIPSFIASMNSLHEIPLVFYPQETSACRRRHIFWTQVLFRPPYHEDLCVFCDLPFNSLMVYLHEQNFLFLMKSNSQIFQLWLVLFVSCWGNLSLFSSLGRYFPVLLSKTLFFYLSYLSL